MLKKQPSEYLNQLYFDSLVFTPEALRHFAAQVGASQIVLGTDFPIPWELHPVDMCSRPRRSATTRKWRSLAATPPGCSGCRHEAGAARRWSHAWCCAGAAAAQDYPPADPRAGAAGGRQLRRRRGPHRGRQDGAVAGRQPVRGQRARCRRPARHAGRRRGGAGRLHDAGGQRQRGDRAAEHARGRRYDPRRDFVPIIELVRLHWALVASPSLHADTLQEFIAAAKAKPGAIDYASGGRRQPAADRDGAADARCGHQADSMCRSAALRRR